MSCAGAPLRPLSAQHTRFRTLTATAHIARMPVASAGVPAAHPCPRAHRACPGRSPTVTPRSRVL
eukprot:scaffold16966_cov131-Isochrysis_galbana.AAC.2